MDSKILEKTLKNFDYNTYKKLDKVAFFSSLYGVFDPIVVANMDMPVLELLMVGYVSLAQMYYFTTSIYDAEKYTKNIVEIKRLYNEFIDKYIELINTFDLQHPVEIYTIYNFMLNKGLLSNSKHFIVGSNNIDDIRSLLGVNIIAGEGVCRHIASMLNDIYNKMNYNSCTATVYLHQNQLLYDKYNDAIKNLKEKINEEYDEFEKREILELLKDLKRLRNISKPKGELYKRIFGNHLITLVSKDNIGYALDPSNKIIYKNYNINESKNILKTQLTSLSSEKVTLTRIHSNLQQKKDILLLPNSTNEEDEFVINNTKNICFNNRDFLFNFKKENKDLYEEIANKLVKIKKK